MLRKMHESLTRQFSGIVARVLPSYFPVGSLLSVSKIYIAERGSLCQASLPCEISPIKSDVQSNECGPIFGSAGVFVYDSGSQFYYSPNVASST